MSHVSQVFHGRKAVAELKLGLVFDDAAKPYTGSFPRSKGRGRIEASALAWRFHGGGFPRSKGRGRIEAGGCSRLGRIITVFHGLTVVAELKPYLTVVSSIRRLGISTAPRPWPN